MFTLGFPFRPWRSDLSIVDGPSIRQYVEDTAREYGIFDKIRFGHKAVRASWSSEDKRWTLEAEHAGGTAVLTCRFLYFASGYYDYAAGHRPAGTARPISAAKSSIRNSGRKSSTIRGKPSR
jgi:cation diffusion facilitator CzcD-associated flavoprotein CzcO